MTQVLVDGSNMWYRAYLATMLDPPGGPVMIMTNMVRKLCERFGKKNVVICWDAGDGGRKTVDPEYKAQRTPRPELWKDFEYMKRMLACLGISTAYLDGYEADDVIASLALRDDNKRIILSYDKDFYQLVSNQISVLQPARTIYGREQPEKTVDRDIVLEEFGCEPEKILLHKCFKGDKSDNIPKLDIRFTKSFTNQFFKVLHQSGDIEEFYSNIDIFDEKYHKQLKGFKERALTNMKLVSFKTDLEVDIATTKLDANDFAALCKEIEINRLRLAAWESIPDEPAPPAPVQRGLF